VSPKLKYDNTGIEDLPDAVQAPVGTYRAQIKTAELKTSKNGNDMVELMLVLTHDASGTKIKENYAPVWYYPIWGHDHPFVQMRWKEFIAAVGLKPKGELDPDKLVNKVVQVKLKSDTDEDGEYRPSIRKLMPAVAGTDAEEEPAPEEPEPEEEPEPDAEEEGQDLSEVIAPMDRNELKAFIKEHELGSLADLGINKATTDDGIREIIVNAWPDDEEEPEPEPEAEAEAEPEAEPEDGATPAAADDGYEDLSSDDLKKELAERELPTGGTKAVKIARLRADDGSEPF
jgi:hypothetical protein